MGSVVGDKDLVLVAVGADAVGELEIARARELLQDVSEHVEDDHAHHLQHFIKIFVIFWFLPYFTEPCIISFKHVQR